jgi:mRNA interferase MazF
MEYFKDFEAWNPFKKNVDARKSVSGIRPGEIRWANIGVNVGSEIDGKGDGFTRPVLIIHVIGKHMSLVVPLSTKIKSRDGYEILQVSGKEVSACIHQIRVISNKRLLGRIQKTSNTKLCSIKERIKVYFNL